MHLRSSADCCTEGVLHKLWRGEVGEALTEVHRFVIGCELCELNPAGAKQVRQSNDAAKCISKTIVYFKHPSSSANFSYTPEILTLNDSEVYHNKYKKKINKF